MPLVTEGDDEPNFFDVNTEELGVPKVAGVLEVDEVGNPANGVDVGAPKPFEDIVEAGKSDGADVVGAPKVGVELPEEGGKRGFEGAPNVDVASLATEENED